MLRQDAPPAHRVQLGGAAVGMACFGRHLPKATPNIVLPHFPPGRCTVVLATMSDDDEDNKQQVTAHNASTHPDTRGRADLILISSPPDPNLIRVSSVQWEALKQAEISAHLIATQLIDAADQAAAIAAAVDATAADVIAAGGVGDFGFKQRLPSIVNEAAYQPGTSQIAAGAGDPGRWMDWAIGKIEPDNLWTGERVALTAGVQPWVNSHYSIAEVRLEQQQQQQRRERQHHA